MRTFLSALITLISFTATSQTITPKPIYKDIALTISELESGRIYFGYQNPEYTTIIDIVSFTALSKSNALALLDKCVLILNMESTSRDQHINDNFGGVQIARYGFAQKQVFLSDGKNLGLGLNQRQLNKIKLALENYTYSAPANK